MISRVGCEVKMVRRLGRYDGRECCENWKVDIWGYGIMGG